MRSCIIVVQRRMCMVNVLTCERSQLLRKQHPVLRVCSEGGNPFVENAIQMAVAAAKAGNAGDEDGEKLFSALLLQGLCARNRAGLFI